MNQISRKIFLGAIAAALAGLLARLLLLEEIAEREPWTETRWSQWNSASGEWEEISSEKFARMMDARAAREVNPPLSVNYLDHYTPQQLRDYFRRVSVIQLKGRP